MMYRMIVRAQLRFRLSTAALPSLIRHRRKPSSVFSVFHHFSLHSALALLSAKRSTLSTPNKLASATTTATMPPLQRMDMCMPCDTGVINGEFRWAAMLNSSAALRILRTSAAAFTSFHRLMRYSLAPSSAVFRIIVISVCCL
eukprot:11162-Heterococcus_DN1.PRE.2